VGGSKLSEAPFVYLNACQVGTGNAVLGDYAGLAANFVKAGASGVVAPLWKVDDVIARKIALRLYPAWFGKTPVGEALRRERVAFATDAAPTSATLLAYQFFGHPALSLPRPRRSR
jgi:CHAT domain-containing protein